MSLFVAIRAPWAPTHQRVSSMCLWARQLLHISSRVSCLIRASIRGQEELRQCVHACLGARVHYRALPVSNVAPVPKGPGSWKVNAAVSVPGERLALADLQHGQRPHPQVQPHQRHAQHRHAQRGDPGLPLEPQPAPRGPGELPSPVSEVEIWVNKLNEESYQASCCIWSTFWRFCRSSSCGMRTCDS